LSRRYDKVALGFLAVVTVVFLVSWRKLLPGMSDTWYHLAVARHVYERAQIPEWADWEFRPWGRPHLYPPLLHAIMALVALPLRGDFVAVSGVMSAVFVPAALWTAWYAARWLLGAGGGLLALVLLSLDLGQLVVVKAYIPSTIVNILLPLLVVTFLSRRAWLSIALLTAMYYAHLGLPHLVALGLLLFGWKFRTYGLLALKVVVIAFVLYTPWLARSLMYEGWLADLGRQMGVPGNPFLKLLSLQIINLLILPAGLVGLLKRGQRDLGQQLPYWLLVGMLPLLASYGGRYFMHSIPLWSLFAARALRGLTPPAPRARRCVGLVLLTLAPVPTIGVFGQLIALPSIAVADTTLALLLAHQPADLGKEEQYGDDCRQIARWLKCYTAPDEVIHVNTEWVAGMVTVLTGRPTDFGAWWEVGKEQARLECRRSQDALPGGVFVFVAGKHEVQSIIHKMALLPGTDEVVHLGRFVVGRRLPRRLVSVGAPISLSPGEASGVRVAVAAPAEALAPDHERPWVLTWRPCTGEKGRLTLVIPLGSTAGPNGGRSGPHPARVVAPAKGPDTSAADDAASYSAPPNGIRLWVKANRAVPHLLIGVRDSRNEVAEMDTPLPAAHCWTRETVVLDWLGRGEEPALLQAPLKSLEVRIPPEDPMGSALEVQIAGPEWVALARERTIPRDFLKSWRLLEQWPQLR
jgi:hypothetical protein